MDELIAETDDAQAIVEKLAKSDKFKATIAKSIEHAKKDVDHHSEEGTPGPTYAQRVRLSTIKGLRDPEFLEKKVKGAASAEKASS